MKMWIVTIGLVKVNVKTIQITCLLNAEKHAKIVVIVRVIIIEQYILAVISFDCSYSLTSFICIRIHYNTNYHNFSKNFNIYDSNNNNVHEEANRVFDANGNYNETNWIDDNNSYNNYNNVIVSFEYIFKYFWIFRQLISK